MVALVAAEVGVRVRRARELGEGRLLPGGWRVVLLHEPLLLQ
jgi:hypothetical protein